MGGDNVGILSALGKLEFLLRPLLIIFDVVFSHAGNPPGCIFQEYAREARNPRRRPWEVEDRSFAALAAEAPLDCIAIERQRQIRRFVRAKARMSERQAVLKRR